MLIDVNKVAKLANLDLTEEESNKFEVQLSAVLEYTERLNELDTKDIKETSQVTGLENVTRRDEDSSSLSQAEALSGAKSKKDSYFSVDSVFKKD